MQQCYHIEALATTFLEVEAFLVRFRGFRHGGRRSLARDAGVRPRYKFWSNHVDRHRGYNPYHMENIAGGVLYPGSGAGMWGLGLIAG